MRPILMRLFRPLFRNPEGTIPVLGRLLSENVRKHIKGYIIAFILMALVAASTAASAWIMRDIINEIFIEKNERMIYTIAGFVLFIYLVKGAATYGQNIVLNRIGNSVVAAGQRRLYDRVLGQDMAFFDSATLGDLVTRMTHSAQSARDVLNLIIVSLGRDLFSLIGLLVVIIVMSPGMSVIALAVAVPAIIGVASLMRKIRDVVRGEFLSLARIISLMQETVLGARVVKAFTAEPEMRTAMYDAIASVERLANRITDLQARTSPLMETLGGFAVAFVILWGGYNVVNLGADPGAFFAFITALLLAYEPAKRLAKLHVAVEANLIGVRMMYEIIDRPLGIVDAEGAKPLALTEGGVQFEDVVFDYNTDKPALKGLSFTAEPGQVTALVGPSGAGKSTVFAMLQRFYDAQEGSVRIDGQDVRDVTMQSLRSHIAMVTQDTFLFDGTVAQNILRGRPDASREEVEAAARAANAHEFIMTMPKGYDAQIGEDGGQLSGGQRQRIAIARAILRDAPILLLDEATSALDAESEFKIQEALKELMKGRTSIVIAHRLSTVREADTIIVMRDGVAVEQGDHATLLAHNGVYEHLHRLQFKA